MSTLSKIIESGILHEGGDTWQLITSGKLLLVDIPFLPDMNLDKQAVTIMGEMGIPHGSPFKKLIAEKIVSHEAIAKRAYELYEANNNTGGDENWLHAENELLGF